MVTTLVLICYTLISLLNSLEKYTNPTTNIRCGRFDDCFIHCSNITSCSNLYFIFENDWSITSEKYNATLICDGIGSCNKVKIFGNRTSSINIDINHQISKDYYTSLDVHILFGNYKKQPQIAHIYCNPCQESQFYYSSLQNNLSLITSTDGIVIHECKTCISNEGNIISAFNIYQLQFKCIQNTAIQSSITIYPPMHNNFNQSFLFQAVPNAIASNQHLFLYFINGLFGKKFECLSIDSQSISCNTFNTNTIRIYCGPYFALLNDADNILTGQYSTDCPSIYNQSWYGHGITSTISLRDVLFFNAHRFQTYKDDYFNIYGQAISNNDAAIIIMVDTYLPQETIPLSILNLPSNANVFIFCNGFDNYWAGSCSGDQQNEMIINASKTSFLMVVGGHIQYTTWYSGNIFISLFYMDTRFQTFHLENADFVYMTLLEDESFYEVVSDTAIMSPLTYLLFSLYISSPTTFALNCNYDSACYNSHLYANSGSYQYIPQHWNIPCYQGGYIEVSPGCDPFELQFADGSRCELDPGYKCKSWETGPPSMEPTKSPTTAAPSILSTSITTSSITTSSITTSSIATSSITTSSITTSSPTNHDKDDASNATQMIIIILIIIVVVVIVCVIGFFIVFKCIGNKKTQKHEKTDLSVAMLSELVKPLSSNEYDDESECVEVDVEGIKQSLLYELSKYQQTDDEDKRNVDDMDMNKVLNCYHEILEHSRKQMEITWYESDNRCDASKCVVFRRHYRDRENMEEKYITDINNTMYNANCQILDKIHCFCHHPVMEMVQNDNEQKKDDDESECVTSNILSSVKSKMNKKYNQLYGNGFNSNDMFIFGWEFKYDDHPNNEKKNSQTHCIYVQKKYNSLKMELTQNKISRINIMQYENEYYKAECHYNCRYRKSNDIFQDMTIQNVLVLMIYCNFDCLQRNFSKTYREENGLRHNEFYNLGKLLKESVIKFGTSIKDGNIKSFYHGVTQKLIPIEIVGDLGRGITIYCPLSTSSSRSVSINFADNNSGLVMVFGGNRCKAKYFSVDWLSDYPSEREQLFLQCQYPFHIKNIIHISTKYEFETILNGLKTMDAVLYESHYFEDENSKKQKENIMSIIHKILYNQLSIHCISNSLEWKPFHDLHPYAQNLLDIYFGNKTKLTINYLVLEQKHPEIFQLFCLSQYEWIKFNILTVIFPNIKEIEIKNIKLCDDIMMNIAQNRFLFYHSNDSWNLDVLSIKANKLSILSGSDAVSKYKHIFKQHQQKLTIRTTKIGDNDEFDTVIIE